MENSGLNKKLLLICNLVDNYFTVFRIVMELGTTVWKDRIRRTEDPDGDIYIGGWRDRKKNGWGHQTTKE